MQSFERWLTSSNGPRRIRTVCKTNWIARVKTWPPLPGNSSIVGPHKKQQMQKCAAPSGKSATAVQLMRHTTSNAGPLRNLLSHTERTRRISNEHARAEALANDSLWKKALGQAVRDAAQATHSLTCEVPD